MKRENPTDIKLKEDSLFTTVISMEELEPRLELNCPVATWVRSPVDGECYPPESLPPFEINPIIPIIGLGRR